MLHARAALLGALGFLLTAWPAPAPAGEETGGATDAASLLAVLEFRDQLKGAHDDVDAGYFADQVREQARAAGLGLRLISRENVQVLLAAQGKSLADCEGECEVETGKKLGADFVISGELLRIGSSLKLNMKLHDTGSGLLMRGATASGKGADALDADLPRAVSALLEPMQAALLERTLSRAAGKNGQMLSALHETMARLQGTLEQMPGLKNPALDSERAQRFQSELNAQAREREQLAAGEVQLDQDRQQLHQALVDGPAHGTVNVRARDLEQRLDELGDQIRRMHTRLALLSDAILSAPAAQSH